MMSIYHMISICKKTHVSFTFLIIILLSFISGLFKDVLTLFTILIIHEIGHIIISCYYKWNISRIDIYACGGYITYGDVIDKPFKEEFMIAVAGIISQSIFFLFVYLLLPEPVVFMFKKYYLA